MKPPALPANIRLPITVVTLLVAEDVDVEVFGLEEVGHEAEVHLDAEAAAAEDARATPPKPERLSTAAASPSTLRRPCLGTSGPRRA